MLGQENQVRIDVLRENLIMGKREKIDYFGLLLAASRGPKGETKKGGGYLPFLSAIQRSIDRIQNRQRRAEEQERFDRACDEAP